MLPEEIMIKENKVITAHFANTQESEVFVLLERPDESLFDTTIEAGEQSPEYVDLLNQISVEDIRKNTVEQQETERKAILAYARSVFEEETAEIESNILRKMITTEEEDNRDFAFKLKLAGFELDQVKGATTEQKKAIRQSNSPLEILYLIGKLVYEE
jgi:hypothetical protein